MSYFTCPNERTPPSAIFQGQKWITFCKTTLLVTWNESARFPGRLDARKDPRFPPTTLHVPELLVLRQAVFDPICLCGFPLSQNTHSRHVTADQTHYKQESDCKA